MCLGRETGISVWGHQDAKEDSLPGHTWVLSKSHLQRQEGICGGQQANKCDGGEVAFPFFYQPGCQWWPLSGVWLLGSLEHLQVSILRCVPFLVVGAGVISFWDGSTNKEVVLPHPKLPTPTPLLPQL